MRVLFFPHPTCRQGFFLTRTARNDRTSFEPTILSGPANVLTVEVQKIDPETLMDQLGFDDKAKTWAGAMYEVLSESDALEKYKDHFDVPPS